MPLVFRLGLLAGVLALGVGVLYVGAGGMGIVVGGVGSTVGGFINGVTSTPSPRPSTLALTDPPVLEQPSEPYTSEPTADLAVTVSPELAGDSDHRIRIYLALADQNPTAIQEAPIGALRRRSSLLSSAKGSTTSRPRSSVRAAKPMRRSPFATCTTTRRRRSASARPRTTPP